MKDCEVDLGRQDAVKDDVGLTVESCICNEYGNVISEDVIDATLKTN